MSISVDERLKQIFDRTSKKGIIKDLKALYNETSDEKVLYRLAKFEFELGRYEDAKTDFRRLRKITGYYSCSNYYLALIFSKLKDHHNSIKHIQKIADLQHGYGTLAMQLYVEEAYKDGDYKTVDRIFEDLKRENLATADVYYYASKAYIHLRMLDKSVSCIGKAVRLNPTCSRYYKVIKMIYERINKNYGPFIQMLKQAVNLDVPYKDKLRLMIPQVEFKNRKTFTIIHKIEKNEEDGITSDKQKELYLYLLRSLCDFKSYISYFEENDFTKNDPTKHIDLVKIYNLQNACDKALEVCDYLREHGINEAKVRYMEAYTFIQMGKYNEAREILFNLMKTENRSYFKHAYNLLITLSYYLENNIEYASAYMVNLNRPDGSKIDSFLRTKLDPDGEPIKYGYDLYSQNLKDYNYQSIYVDNRNQLSPYNVSGLVEGINIGNFLNEMTEITSTLTPSYRLYKDSYLIDYGEKVGFVRDEETSLFVVDRIPDQGIYRVKPIIPVDEAIDNFQRVR